MHPYRTHTCGALRVENVGDATRLSGWVHRKRDHGGLLFIDMRDHYGMTQIICDPDSPVFSQVEKLQKNMVLRSDVVASMRQRMWSKGFKEFQTPIITASSPEGARDFLVPSRLHPGKFYALPQAPQQFKQLIMVSGFDKYFQIAPCFRDEDPRADRSPTDFYQLDLEMSFVDQQDIFDTIQPVLQGVFEEFGGGRKVDTDWEQISYRDAALWYG